MILLYDIKKNNGQLKSIDLPISFIYRKFANKRIAIAIEKLISRTL